MKMLMTAAALCLAAISFSAAPASAGECPAANVGVNVTPPGPMAPAKVTDNVIAAINLANGYGVPGKQMRMRRLVIEPGGIVPWHSHKERAANIYVVSGQVTEYRSSCSTPILHLAGDVVAEQGDISHWWKNNSKKNAVLISADIVAAETEKDGGM